MMHNKVLEISQKLAAWWNACSKLDHDIIYLINGRIQIDSYRFTITSGNRAFLNAVNEDTHLSILDCDAPVNGSELISILRTKLNKLLDKQIYK